MNLRINDIAPDFSAHSAHGKINFHEWIGDPQTAHRFQ
jgi:alkyl hydroperoxide reductase subunit AhpC